MFPFAIYDDDTLVGFMLVEEDMDEKRLDLRRFMLSPQREGRGLGTAAVELLIRYAGIPGGTSTCSFFARPKMPPPGTSMTSWASVLPERSASETWKWG